MYNLKKFIPGKSYIPVTGKVFDSEEIDNVIKVARDGWWTEGEFAKQFERGFSKFMGVRYVSLVNSGSSANLVAFASLTSKIFGEKRLKKGDEYLAMTFSDASLDNKSIVIMFQKFHQKRAEKQARAKICG